MHRPRWSRDRRGFALKFALAPLERPESSRVDLKILLKRAPFGLALNDYVACDGPALFAQACAIGLEGIVSKRRRSPYRSGLRIRTYVVKRHPEGGW